MNPMIELDGIAKSYRQAEEATPALQNVSLRLGAGECVAVCGPSGSGKSTLLNICGLIDQPDRGHYHLNSQSVDALSEQQRTRLRRQHIGFIFQQFNLIPVMTAHENIAYPLMLMGWETGLGRQRVDALLEAVGLAGQGHKRPDLLSGGQRQRVAIARALVKSPALVIADEPTASLDTATANQIIDLMHTLGRENGTCFLIATHDERMARRCHRVLHLEDGRLS